LIQKQGPELLIWGTYLDDGGQIFPLSIMTDENDPPPTTKTAEKQDSKAETS
jgi:hypothetical protein